MTEDAESSARQLAKDHGLRYVDLALAALAPTAASLMPEALARRHHAVPIGRRLGTPVVAVSDPGDLYAMDAVRTSVGREFIAVVAPPDQVDWAIQQLYSPDLPEAEGAGIAGGAGAGSPALNGSRIPGEVASNGHGPAVSSSEPAGDGESEPAPVSASEPAEVASDGHGLAVSASEPAPVSASEPAGDGEPGKGLWPPPVPEGYGLLEPFADEGARDSVHGDTADGVAREGSEEAFAGPPLAQVLVESGKVSPEDMRLAITEHERNGESLARYLFNHQLVTEEDLVQAMAKEVGLDYVDLNKVAVEPHVASLIPESVARHHMVLPIQMEQGKPVVAMANPTDVFAMDDLRTIMGRNFQPVVATRSQIAAHIRMAYGADVDVAGVAADAADEASGTAASFEIESLQSVIEDAPIVRYVNLLILQALHERASDIHIEPTPKRLRIRFRIDGVMHDATSASLSIHSAVVSRLKVLGEMDISERRVPQEGRVSLAVSDRQIDLRLATLPSLFGETCVMRLHDRSASIRSLPDLGFYPDSLQQYAQAYRHPYGVILVTGPTGAGKTTTLYATLQEVLTKEKSVVTVEDPVEYQIDGVTQVQINRRAGLDFATALRSILRSDPDIVLIGEIRDLATASIAMEAALSGHLVLTTLHTNTAAATPLRLTEMGIEPFLVTSGVTGVLTQRLARVLCQHCKEPYEASEAEFLAAGYRESDLEGIDLSTLYRAVGCRSCGQTGYYGRMVLAEILNMSEEVDRMIIEQQSIVNIERQACEQGMRTLRQDGLLKVVDGLTTLQEVLRVVI